jgi:recombination protein RecT
MSVLIPASTLIIIHEDSNGLELLMVKRNPALKFAGGFFAFPGGKIEANDFQDNQKLKAAKIAALRECYEEIGFVPNMYNNSGSFEKIIKNYPLESIFPLSRWRPPPEITPKFDTYFFFTKSNQRFVPIVDGKEIIDSIWISPQKAIEKYKTSEMKLLFPTIMTIHLLSKLQSFEAIMRFANWENPPIIQTQSEIVDNKPTQFIDQSFGYPLYHASFLH